MIRKHGSVTKDLRRVLAATRRDRDAWKEVAKEAQRGLEQALHVIATDKMKPLSPGVQKAMDRFDEALAKRRLVEGQEPSQKGTGEVKREDTANKT